MDITSLLWYNGTNEWRYLPEKCKINVVLAKGEYHCGVEEKTRCNSTVKKVIFIAAEILYYKNEDKDLMSVQLLH